MKSARVSAEPAGLAVAASGGSAMRRLRASLDMADGDERRRTLARLVGARVAGHEDAGLLEGTQKSDIYSVRVLGEGAFGLVDLVLVDQKDNTSLLCVRKRLLKQGERNVNDPEMEVAFLNDFKGATFIVQMWSHVVGLYDYTLLLEYFPYGALDKLLQAVIEVRSQVSGMCMSCMNRVLGRDRICGFTEAEARFYIACAVLGLETMHAQGVLHRDLKPSNLLVAENRYVKLGDLGLCKRLGASGIAHSHAGTPGYICPEMLHDKTQTGYSYPADLWSLGIMAWELADGLPPRWAPMSWYFTPSLHFPDHFSPELRSLLTGLLDKNPSHRIKLPAIKAHAWFQGLDWDALAAEKLEAPSCQELEMVHLHTRLALRDQ